MKIELNGKALIAILALSGSIVFADFVSVVNVKDSGGITLAGVSETEVEDIVNEALPIGTIAMWGNATLPSGWLELNGDAIPAEYSELSALYSGTLPDLRGEFVRGWDHGKGTDSGRTLADTQLDQMQKITGSMNVAGYYASTSSIIDTFSGALYNNGSPNSKSGLTFNATASGRRSTTVGFDSSRVSGVRTGSETRPRNVSLMYIIKAE